jgi:hypothetical protein
VSIFFGVLGPKRVELLHELLPTGKTVAVLGNPRHPNFQLDTPDIRAAADALTQRLEVLPASTEGELEAAFSTMTGPKSAAALDALKTKMTKHGWFGQEAIAARKEQRAVLRRLKATAKKMANR